MAAISGLAEAAAESAAAHAADELRCLLLHARIQSRTCENSGRRSRRYSKFAQIPRAGDQVYGFAAGLYPTDALALPDAERD